MSNGTFSQTTLIGRVGKDPSVHTFDDGSLRAAFSLATSESWKDSAGAKQERAHWHNVVAFNGLAKVVAEHVKKGDLVQVVGQNETREYERDSAKHRINEVVMRGPGAALNLLGPKRE
jgi:single-strand DNA-binding protein